MHMKKNTLYLAASATLGLMVSLLLAGCASGPTVAELDALTDRIVKASFRTQGIANVERVTATDETNRACSEADAIGKRLDEKSAKAIEEANFKSIRWPADGKFVGDWRQGEAIAQNGRGLTWTDDAKMANGGNCYNCHQMDKKEISYGTIGPSLYNFGKLRGVTDVNSPEAKAMLEYTWGKVWNAKAYNACSNMPRAGHMGILTEAQVRHVVGLLLDPQSPVNQ